MDVKSTIYCFCNYQERSQQEVRNKLYELGAYTEQVNGLIAELIQADLLNEERFARAYVRGRFRLKHWGRIKIAYELRPHRLSEYVLNKAFNEINASEYFQTAVNVATRKWEQLKSEKQSKLKQNKLYRYMRQKGYEQTIISELMSEVINE